MPRFPPSQTNSGPRPGYRRVSKRLADGSAREYWYPKKRVRQPRHAAGTIGALIIAYKQSQEWRDHSPATQTNYSIYLRILERRPDALVAALRRREILDLRDAIAETRGRGAATVFIRVTSALLNWAVDREWIESNPANRIRLTGGGHLQAWTREQADQAEAALPEPYRRVVIVARYTGQRRGDLIRMRWTDWHDGALHVVQQKTGTALAIPIHPILHRELMTWRQNAASEFILTTHTGRQWRGEHLSSMLPIALQRIGLPPLGAHGLRKLAATALAEAGCSTHEIAAITGHKSLSMVQLYTASHDQQRLARAAIIRLSRRPKKKPS